MVGMSMRSSLSFAFRSSSIVSADTGWSLAFSVEEPRWDSVPSCASFSLRLGESEALDMVCMCFRQEKGEAFALGDRVSCKKSQVFVRRDRNEKGATEDVARQDKHNYNGWLCAQRGREPSNLCLSNRQGFCTSLLTIL